MIEQDDSDLPIVAFDESGNSGQNLVDPAQPVFVLAAVGLQPGRAAELVVGIGEDGKEAKFSELRSSVEGREAVLRLIGDPVINPRTARLSVVDKPWMLAAKFIDVLVEPYFAERRRNIYAGGMHLAMTQRLYEAVAEATGADRWIELQRAFIEAMRRPTQPRRERFNRALRDARAACDDDSIAVLLDAVLAQDDAIGDVSAETVKHQLDPAPTALVEQLNFWSDVLGPHRVVHDEAGAIRDWQAHIERLSDPAVEPAEIDFGHTTAHYPLQTRVIELGASDQHPAIQVADVIAGAAVALTLTEVGARPRDEFAESLAESPLPQLVGWRLPGA